MTVSRNVRNWASAAVGIEHIAWQPNPMCNLYNLKASARDIAAVFNALDASGGALEKDYVSPGRPVLVVTGSAAARQLRAMRWGVPPPPGVRNAVVNVRNYQSPFWRSALSNPERRCLVPVTSFQEWSVEPDPTTGKKKPEVARFVCTGSRRE
ncbi:SOS response-associated peptidase family protein [Sphingomonas sp.]|uniref:SOS response-associated peptidase family protein n=1 Tax=Sphingomonas sp. TaxID=28214 RepID=UPI0031D67DB2